MVTAVHSTRWCMAPWEKRPIQQVCDMVAPSDLDRCSFGTSSNEEVKSVATWLPRHFCR